MPGRADFFLPVRVLSRVFRGKFIERLKAAHREGKLRFHGNLKPLATSAAMGRLLNESVENEWVVYAKPPFGGPEQVLKYLARYTHRVAISNGRLLALEDDKVTFRWKDYAHGNRKGTMTLKATEFIRRFLMHVMPPGFVRIRYYGFMANRRRAENLARCRRLLDEQRPAETTPKVMTADDTSAAAAGSTAEDRNHHCPVCRQGRMRLVGLLQRQRTSCDGASVPLMVLYRDTS